MMLTLEIVNLRRWHRAIVVFFSAIGVAGASMMVRMPLVRETLEVTTAQLGILLVCGAIGALIGLSLVGRFIARFGSRRAALLGMTVWFVGTIAQIASLGTHSAVLFAIGGFVAGLGVGNTDVAINVDGAAIEQRLGRAALPRMHAAFSIGALVGAGLGTVAIVLNIDIALQLAVIAVAAYAIPLLGLRHMPADNGLHTDEQKQGGGWGSIDKLVVLLGIGIFGMTLGEGASNDWLAIGIVDGYQATDADGGVAYAILVGTMTVVRFFGGSVTDRLGRAATLRYSGILGLLGLFLIILKVSVPIAWIGSGLWGVGVALAFPLFISAAAELDDPARKVAMVSTFGYVAFLVGPPLLGFVGENIGVLNMYWLILMFIALSVVAAGAAGSRRR